MTLLLLLFIHLKQFYISLLLLLHIAPYYSILHRKYCQLLFLLPFGIRKRLTILSLITTLCCVRFIYCVLNCSNCQPHQQKPCLLFLFIYFYVALGMTIFVIVDRWIQSWFHWENSHVRASTPARGYPSKIQKMLQFTHFTQKSFHISSCKNV